MAPRLRDANLSSAYRRRVREAAVDLVNRAGRVGGRLGRNSPLSRIGSGRCSWRGGEALLHYGGGFGGPESVADLGYIVAGNVGGTKGVAFNSTSPFSPTCHLAYVPSLPHHLLGKGA